LIRQQQQKVPFQGAHHVLCIGDAQPVLLKNGEYSLHDAPVLRRFVDMHYLKQRQSPALLTLVTLALSAKLL